MRNLYMIDVVAIPQRLEHRIGKAKYENVLHRFLAEIMIDAIRLRFIKCLFYLTI